MTRLIPDWEIRVTNFGLGYILMCLVVAIAATNTGNNGLYLVLAAMLAAMVVSGMLSRRNVRGVACEIEPIGEVVATRPAWLKLKLENRLRAGTAQALFFLHESLPGPLWIDPLGPGEKRELIVEGTFPRRGVYREADAGLLSRFPLGPLPQVPQGDPRRRRSSSIRCRSPTPFPSSRPRMRAAGAPIRARAAAAPTSGRSGSSRPATTPAICTGNSRRACGGGSCASARRSGTACCFWRSTTPCPGPRTRTSLGRFESAVARCAGQALLLLSRGAEVGFHARGVKVAARGGRSQRVRILDALARLEPVPSESAGEFPAMRKGDLRWFVS